MRRFLFLISAAAVCGMAACERRPAVDPTAEKKQQEQREADERRIAELRDLEQRAADREAEEAAAELDKQRQALEAERAKLERDRAALNEEQRRVADARIEKIREEEAAAERRDEARRAEQRKRDQQLAEERLASQRTEQNLDFFYDALDPQGDWMEVERYGYCWQPNAARRPDWRPYLDGSWVYTNYGWTWDSREPFGWATYHYGRWTRVRGLGWVWVPGSEWAPAWVSWRRSDRHIGWAPLPPEAHSRGGFNAGVDSRYDIGPGLYNFVAVENFGEPSYVRQVVAPEQNIVVLRQTVNVTNVTYQNVDNRVVVFNEGPRFAEVNQRAKVRRMNVERVSQGPGRAEERGDTLRMFAPVVAPAAKETRPPKRVRENVKAPVMERGWSGAPAAVVSEVREQQKEEARKSGQGAPAPRPGGPGSVSPPKSDQKPAAPTPGTPESKDPKPTTQPSDPGRPSKGSRPTEPPAGISTTEPPRKPPVTSPKPDAETAKPPGPPVRPVPQPAAIPESNSPPAAKPNEPAAEGGKPVRQPGGTAPAIREPKPSRPAPEPTVPPAGKPENVVPAALSEKPVILPAPKTVNELKLFNRTAPEKKPTPSTSGPTEDTRRPEPPNPITPAENPKRKPDGGMRRPSPPEAIPATPPQVPGAETAPVPTGGPASSDEETKAKKGKGRSDQEHPQPAGLRKRQNAGE